jgi:hypothetical protein
VDLVLLPQVDLVLLVHSETDQILTETLEHQAPTLDVPHRQQLFLAHLPQPHVLQL